MVKEPEEVSIRYAFALDVYAEMSHLGMKILYHLINENRTPIVRFAPG